MLCGVSELGKKTANGKTLSEIFKCIGNTNKAHDMTKTMQRPAFSPIFACSLFCSAKIAREVL